MMPVVNPKPAMVRLMKTIPFKLKNKMILLQKQLLVMTMAKVRMVMMLVITPKS